MEPMTSFKVSLKLLSFVLLCTLLLPTCAYDSDDDNFVDVPKPSEQFQIGIDLAGVDPDQVIYLYSSGYFYYSLDTRGKEILDQKFFLDGRDISSGINNGSVYINGGPLDGKEHELKMIVGFKTGTGSLAELAGYEMYVGEYTFKLKFIDSSTNSAVLNVRQTVDANNNLKLVWDRPQGFDVVSYEIYSNEYTPRLLATIPDPDQTWFVDQSYVYGYKSYQIAARLRNSQQVKITTYYTVSYSSIEAGHIQGDRINRNSLRTQITNTNPYPCKYVVEYGYENKIVEAERSGEIVLPGGDFPSWISFHLYILPLTADVSEYKSYPYVYGSLSDRMLEAHISLAADLHGNRLVGMDFRNYYQYDVSTALPTFSKAHNLTLHTGCIMKASNTGYVVVSDSRNILYIYKDNTFNNLLFQIQTQGLFFCLTDNNLLFVQTNDGFDVYNILTGSLVGSQKLISSPDEVYSQGLVVRISSDARYLYVLRKNYYTSEKQLELYEVNPDYSLKLLRTESDAKISAISFHPVNPRKAVIEYSDIRFSLVEVETGVRTTVAGYFQNIDPFTGAVLYKAADYISGNYEVKVLDSSGTKEIWKMKLANINPFADTRLYNNLLMFNGYVMNLTK